MNDGNGIGGKDAAPKLTDAEHGQKNDVFPQRANRQPKSDASGKHTNTKGDKNSGKVVWAQLLCE
ncbi:MAG: hypothetical protein KHW69_09120 [Clostridium sp.]|nr:hypothetical protein [Clostridium sp.]